MDHGVGLCAPNGLRQKAAGHKRHNLDTALKISVLCSSIGPIVSSRVCRPTIIGRPHNQCVVPHAFGLKCLRDVANALREGVIVSVVATAFALNKSGLNCQ